MNTKRPWPFAISTHTTHTTKHIRTCARHTRQSQPFPFPLKELIPPKTNAPTQERVKKKDRENNQSYLPSLKTHIPPPCTHIFIPKEKAPLGERRVHCSTIMNKLGLMFLSTPTSLQKSNKGIPISSDLFFRKSVGGLPTRHQRAHHIKESSL